jgi:hypothetical protein
MMEDSWSDDDSYRIKEFITRMPAVVFNLKATTLWKWNLKNETIEKKYDSRLK